MSWRAPAVARDLQGAEEARWRRIKAAWPGAELEYQATPMGRMTRGRLGPDGEWTAWRLRRGAVLGELEQAAEAVTR
jgi:hypothetical protein